MKGATPGIFSASRTNSLQKSPIKFVEKAGRQNLRWRRDFRTGIYSVGPFSCAAAEKKREPVFRFTLLLSHSHLSDGSETLVPFAEKPLGGFFTEPFQFAADAMGQGFKKYRRTEVGFRDHLLHNAHG